MKLNKRGVENCIAAVIAVVTIFGLVFSFVGTTVGLLWLAENVSIILALVLFFAMMSVVAFLIGYLQIAWE